jgi:hypothetical protein
MSNSYKKFIAGMLLFLGGAIPFSMPILWVPCIVAGWILLYNWVE